MPQVIARSLRVVVDGIVLSIAYWFAFLFRFEFAVPASQLDVVLLYWPIVIGVHYTTLTGFKVPRMAWRYMTMLDTGRILVALTVSTTLIVVARLALPLLSRSSFVFIPLGVLAMQYVLAFVGLVGVRAAWRLRGEVRQRRMRSLGAKRRNVLLVGAGEAGVIVAREIANRPDLGLRPVGFVDDDRLKVGTSIGGLLVLGTTAEISVIAAAKRTKHALITIASASGQQIRRIAETCRDAGVDTKIIPGIYEIVGNKVNLSRIREVAIEDLLGREPVHLDEDVVGSSIRSRVVLVTGAGGSIGSELCRQICRFGPSRLVLVERFENALFEIHRRLVTAFPHLQIEPVVADVCDSRRMAQVFDSLRPELVFHAAAHKHVPMMEWNPAEAVKNNVGGTCVLADLALEFDVERFVLISTDKAVNPTSVMGATKRCAEIYLQGLSEHAQTRFVTVRFGNVLGSAGSVVPIFREQIAKGGPITITHPDMFRYFMTIPEASQLVLQAGAMGAGGEIFILDMGEPVRILDLARDLITLSGLRPYEDIDILVSGIRPGEKLREEISTDSEHADKTKHPKIFIGRSNAHEWKAVKAGVTALLELAQSGDVDRIRGALVSIVPEYGDTRRSAAVPRQSGASPEMNVFDRERDRSRPN